MQKLLDWFITSEHGHRYMPGWECMHGDVLWGWITVALCMTIIIGYTVIAMHWKSNLVAMKDGIAKTALGRMVGIFVFCSICGYFFLIMKMWWPAWKLHAIFLAIL